MGIMDILTLVTAEMTFLGPKTALWAVDIISSLD